jgi:hypothetical protein
MTSGIPFTNIYPDGPATGGGTSVAAGDAQLNAQYPGMPAGASPIHKDVTIAAAATTALWTPSAGMKFILTGAFVSTDTAMRIALVDDSDIPGSRPVDGFFAANGGASPNLVPVPYPSKNAGNVLRVVTGAAGNVKVRVSGWEVPG